MPNPDKFEVVKIPGLKETDKGLAFLRCDTRNDINAKTEFDRLKEKKKNDVRNRFDYWLNGFHFDRYFHGFPGHPQWHELYIFKWQQGRVQHRLYGFLLKPRLPDGFQVCILVCYGSKPGGDHHDPAKLALAEALRLNIDVTKEVKRVFLKPKTR
ncbi:MAG: hypothetical protein ABR501_06770 [Pyrinomonadaceae bacterium]